MLSLERVVESAFWIGDGIRVKVIAVKGRRVRLGISAPKSLTILREELLEAVVPQAVQVPVQVQVPPPPSGSDV